MTFSGVTDQTSGLEGHAKRRSKALSEPMTAVERLSVDHHEWPKKSMIMKELCRTHAYPLNGKDFSIFPLICNGEVTSLT